jgi:hypothetical protein
MHIEPILVLPGNHEKEWHARFAHLRDGLTGGKDWFHYTQELKDAINLAKEQAQHEGKQFLERGQDEPTVAAHGNADVPAAD